MKLYSCRIFILFYVNNSLCESGVYVFSDYHNSSGKSQTVSLISIPFFSAYGTLTVLTNVKQ